jgi:hypothetical protein
MSQLYNICKWRFLHDLCVVSIVSYAASLHTGFDSAYITT